MSRPSPLTLLILDLVHAGADVFPPCTLEWKSIQTFRSNIGWERILSSGKSPSNIFEILEEEGEDFSKVVPGKDIGPVMTPRTRGCPWNPTARLPFPDKA